MTETTMQAGEPTPAQLTQPILRYVLATRPAFLTITVVGCLLGMALAWSDGAFDLLRAVATLVLALLAHAAVNVLNDYCDHHNGTDARNTQRLFPYTGGSRFIQNGVLTAPQVGGYAAALFAATIAGGVWLLVSVGEALFWIGAAGLFIGWAYSAPPLRLNSRGWGELCVFLGFLLVVVGAYVVQHGTAGELPWLAGAPYALLAANILYINQFPDREADLASGKLHWVARLQPAVAARGYGLILGLATLALCAIIVTGMLPGVAALSLVALIPGVAAARLLARHAATPEQLAPAIRLTLLAAHAQPVLLAGTLVWAGHGA